MIVDFQKATKLQTKANMLSDFLLMRNAKVGLVPPYTLEIEENTIRRIMQDVKQLIEELEE